MFEQFDGDDLLVCPRHSFDKDEFFKSLYDKKVLKFNGATLPKAERVRKQEDFKKKENPQSYGEKMWGAMVDEEQIIPMEFWDNHSLFDSGNALARMHPHFIASLYEAANRWECKTDTLVLLSCTEFKPYSQLHSTKQYVKLAKKIGFDLAILSDSIVPVYPYDASKQYPFNIYNWPMNREGQFSHLISQWTAMQLGFLISRNGYKKIIFVSSGGEKGHYVNQFDEMQRVFPHIKMAHIGAPNTFVTNLLRRRYGNLAGLRMQSSLLSRICVCAMLGKDARELLAETDDSKMRFDAALGMALEAASELYPQFNVTLENLGDVVWEYWNEGVDYDVDISPKERRII